LASGSGNSTKRTISRRKRIIFASIPIVAALLVVEIAARIYEAATREKVALVDPAELHRRDGEILVYVYGESTVWGFPLMEVGLVAQMQYLATLRNPGRRIRILNLGVPSIDSARLKTFVEDTIENRPDLAIVLCGHNEFLRPPVGRQPSGVLRHSAIARIASDVAARSALLLEDSTPEGLTKPLDRADGAFRLREEVYRENMAAIVETVRGRGVSVLLASPASNLRDWPPVFRRLARNGGDDAYEPSMERALAADAQGDVAALQSCVETWQDRRRGDAMVRFLQGRLRLAQEDHSGALRDFVFARDEDPIPCRMTSTLYEALRSVATDARVPYVDLAEALGDDIPDANLIVDNCHPTPEGAHRMAIALLRAAESADLLPAPATNAEPPVDEFLAAAGCVLGSPLRHRMLVENGKYAMRRPLYHYPIAERRLRQAALEYPQSWEVHANLATALLLQRRIDEGLDELQRAESLHGSPLDMTDVDTLPYLKVTLDALDRQ
jgi:lysophospholipase L1-like esterase